MFIKKTVDGVLAGFNRTVQDLRDIAAQRQAVIVKNDDAITLLSLESAAAQAERNRAHAIADKLEKLVS
jgi:hypothetical protein